MSNVITLSELQTQQSEWSRNNFPNQPSWHPLLGAVEELGELCHAHLKAVQGIRMNENHRLNKEDAVADAIIFLCGYCTAEGIDIARAVDRTWNEVKQRDWRYPIINSKENDHE